MRALLATLLIAAFVVAGVTLLTGDMQHGRTTPPPSGTATVGLRPVPAPRLTAEQINRQDPLDARRQRGEAHAFDRRPLLNALPTTLQGVRFDIGGLAADGRTTIIRADARGLGRRRARVAYATLRRRTGDRSRSYRIEIRP
ncbi:MAG: hypothetical protein LC790_19480 [Actinobacteria bacterium]|nr:hypothetical protein [Actinomycetota bacterium]MCA1700956.1 hypothetical protein [Actinomycetota bacterium]